MGSSVVRTGRACDAVLARLEELIASGAWPVGSRIPPEPELVTLFGVGRNTLREAVRALEHAGMLEPRRGDGTYVRATSALGAAVLQRARRGELLHIMEVRASLERDAAAAAAHHRSEEELAVILEAVERRRAAWDAGDRTGYLTADIDFHRAVIAATGNPLLIDLYGGLTEAVLRSVAEVDGLQVGTDVFPGHEELAAAIANHDPVAAVAAADTYLAAASRILATSGMGTDRAGVPPTEPGHGDQ